MTKLLAPRLAAAFAAPRAGRAALIPYVTGGFPDLAASHDLIEAFVAGGADIVELGIPYSDPIADGPVVQHSSHQALLRGTTADEVLQLAAAHAAAVPFVLLTYVNTVLAYSPERFFAAAAASGVEALVIPDLPADEGLDLVAAAAERGVAVVPMAAPTTTEARLDLIAARASAFIYCVSVTGVTGARSGLGPELPGLLARLRARTSVPLAVGFGISTPRQAAEVAGLADGVIVGSALIDLIAGSKSTAAACEAVERLLREMGAAMATEA
jgi:tryptophan synthase alpha chain